MATQAMVVTVPVTDTIHHSHTREDMEVKFKCLLLN